MAEVKGSYEASHQILSIKTLGGDLFAGTFVETKKLYGRDVHIVTVDGIKRYVPVMQCEWWALGEKSVPEVQRELQEQYRKQAREVLREYQEAPEDEEESVSELDREGVAEARRQVSDPNNVTIQTGLRNIANHQRRVVEQPLNDRVIQPGDEEEGVPVVRKRGAQTLRRLPDDTPEV